jgi:hypothetical protein
MANNTEHFMDELKQTIDEMMEVQQHQLLETGRRIVPTLTQEDMLQPNDYTELENHPFFRYEEGILAGIQTVQMALRALEKDFECFDGVGE